MPDLGNIQQLMTEGVPFNRVLGIRVVSISPEQAEVALPAAPERLNHVGTTHAAVQFGLGESAAGTMVIAAFGDLRDQGYVPLAVRAEIIYRHPARGDLLGVATLTTAEQAHIRAEVAAKGKVRFSVPVQILDAQETVVAELSIQWVFVKQE